MKIVSVEQMRALERATFDAGTSEAELQERAGRAVAEVVQRLVQPGEHVAVIVGHGNNGRDGMIAGRSLLGRGLRVTLVLAPRHALTAEELLDLRRLGGTCVPFDHSVELSRVLDAAALVVDGVAGIGTRGALREPLAGMVRQLAGRRVVAIDVPSGIDADTGALPGDAVSAEVTVTLGAVKQGLLRFPAAERVGRLIARDIGIPRDAEAGLAYDVLDPGALSAPARPLGAHKYRFGRVLVIAGSDHFLGAPVMCAGGALRVGAGLVTVASTRDVRLNVAAHFPEATFTTADLDVLGDPARAIDTLRPYLESHSAVVVGPGLGRGQAVTSFVEQLLRVRPREHALVIDADGLVALSEIADWPSLVDNNVVLTPHAGELARLAGRTTEDWEDAAALAQAWRCVLIAKGPFTSVAGVDGKVAVWPHANPALATGGTGDVLAGICAGLLAQGVPSVDTARLAVVVHALAAERVVGARGWRTLLATDLLQEVPAVLASLPASDSTQRSARRI